MSFTGVVFAVHAFYHKLSTTPLPYKVDTNLHRLCAKSNYNHPRNILFRNLVKYIMSSLAVGCLALISWLFSWENDSQKHLEQAVLYLIMVCAIGIYKSFFYTQEVHGKTLMYPQNQLVTLQPSKSISTKANDIAKFLFVWGLPGAIPSCNACCSMFCNLTIAIYFWHWVSTKTLRIFTLH